MLHANTFASAHPMWVASQASSELPLLHKPLPQRIPCGLHQQRCTRYIAWIYEMCCELVHSFSITHKGMTALTIFPYSSAVKAACAAISDRLGRTIDRFILVRTAPENSVSLHFAGYPCWRAFSVSRTIVLWPDRAAARIADTLFPEPLDQSFAAVDYNAVIKTRNTNRVESVCRPAWYSTAATGIFLYILSSGDYTDWLSVWSEVLRLSADRGIGISVSKSRSAYPVLCLRSTCRTASSA